MRITREPTEADRAAYEDAALREIPRPLLVRALLALARDQYGLPANWPPELRELRDVVQRIAARRVR